MKNLITVFGFGLFLVCFIGCKPSKEEQSIEAKTFVEAFLEANTKEDFGAVADMLYPKSLEKIGGKAIFIKQLKAFYNQNGFTYKMSAKKNSLELFPIKSFEEDSLKGDYLVGKYMIEQKLYFKDSTLTTYRSFLNSYNNSKIVNSATIVGDSIANSITITEPKYFAVVKDNTTAEEWKVINFVPIFEIESIFPKPVLKDLKVLYSKEEKKLQNSSFE